jgi:hypothetical protein
MIRSIASRARVEVADGLIAVSFYPVQFGY